ncbi:hypothetical protein PIB30_079754 [Stylosanthes scabra]|uniref:Uncharacterized protein n=1 Tax=Stylosanthes scabra TaxID=79078 RepID=A0ABU6UQP0_9FABA|nr:hypothetical protein [Stylosanthes scabra]
MFMMSSPRSTIAIPIHASFNNLMLPSHFYDEHKRELCPQLMFQNEFGNSFLLNLRMEPDVGLIYDGFKEILEHHNINGGGIIIATYHGSCIFSTKAKQPIQPDIQHDSCRHRRNARGNTTQISNKNRKAKIYESDQDSCLQTKQPKGWPCYLVAMVDGEYVVEKPVRNYHLTQYTMTAAPPDRAEIQELWTF